MNCGTHSRLKIIRAAAMVVAGMALSAQATIYRDCFEVEFYGDIRHVACTIDGLTDIHYAVDKFKTNEWEVVCHGGGNESRIVKAQPGEHILADNVFTNNSPTISGAAYPFVFEFCNWYKQGASGTTWYGYVSLGLDEKAELVILESAITDRQGELKVVGTPEPVLPPNIRTIDHGDWLELDGNCIKQDTEGWIAIPSAINGKPIRAIGRHAFSNCRNIARITTPDTVESIGDNAFDYCRSLVELEIPSSVTNIGALVMNGCDALGELRIGSGIASIPRIAFVGTGMTNLVMSAGTTNIEEYAFASNTRLKSVTIPQSMDRIHSLAFDGCTSLTAVSVPCATIVEDGAFPAGCTITRYGPRIRTSAASKLDAETESALMLTMDRRVYQSKELVDFMPARPPYVEEHESEIAPIACAHLGVSPFAIWAEDGKDYIEAYYKMPTVEFVGIDPAMRTITGRVVPAEGTCIVSAPIDRAFGFHRIYSDENGAMLDGLDWGREMYYGYPGFELDTSCYVESNGLFRITFPEDVLWEKNPQPAHLFRIHLSDKAGGLW